MTTENPLAHGAEGKLLDALDDLVGPMGAAHPDAGDVSIVRTPSGGAFFAPASLRRLDGEQQEVAASLQRAALAALQVQQLVAQQVDEARAAGLSWSAIGWCLGVTGEASRQRFGRRPDDV